MKTLSRIWGCLIGILGVAHGLFAQIPNEVYRNELIGVIIRYEGSEGGYDWAFTQALPTYVVSFDYKGSSVTLRGLTGQRLVRAQNPLPRGFKLSHNDVIVDGFPATNYNDYMNYYNGLYEALSATPLGAYAGRKSAGYKEADAKQKALGKRVSWHISPKYDLYNQATLISLNVTF